RLRHDDPHRGRRPHLDRRPPPARGGPARERAPHRRRFGRREPLRGLLRRPGPRLGGGRVRHHRGERRRRPDVSPAARRGRVDALRRALRRRAAGLGGRHRRRDPAHGRRGDGLERAAVSDRPARVLRRRRAGAAGLDRGRRRYGPRVDRRRRHLGAPAAAHPARRQLDPCARSRAGRPRPGGRRRGAGPAPRGLDAAPPGGAREGPVIPKRWIEAYLWFLLRNRLAVTIAVAVMTVFFAYETTHLKVVPQFLDFYPGPSTVRVFGHEYTWRKGHPYINIYKGIRGLYVALDDSAALVTAGFWEEELDFNYLYDRMMELKRDVEDANHTVYITGFPWLYTSVLRYVPEVREVFVITVAALAFLL